MSMSKHIVIALVGVAALTAFRPQPHAQGGKPGTGLATFTALPSLPAGGPSEALGVDDAGTAIVGYSWDRYDVMHAVKWTVQNGSWVINSLPHGNASSAISRSVSNHGDVAGNNFPSATSQPVLWPASGGFSLLGCNDVVAPATVYGISAGAQIIAGQHGTGAAVWQAGSCTTDLPPLVVGSSAGARAANGDGTIVGGRAAAPALNSSVPVRWMFIGGQWVIEQLDARAGSAHGANGAGDLAGYVVVPCELVEGCQRAAIWYAGGGSSELNTLGGAHSWARDINGSGEVVGASTAPRIGNTGFFWSASRGMVQLPFKGSWAAANGLSEVRPDGTRLVVGMSSQGVAMVWIVR